MQLCIVHLLFLAIGLVVQWQITELYLTHNQDWTATMRNTLHIFLPCFLTAFFFLLVCHSCGHDWTWDTESRTKLHPPSVYLKGRVRTVSTNEADFAAHKSHWDPLGLSLKRCHFAHISALPNRQVRDKRTTACRLVIAKGKNSLEHGL
jgi:hypothetical protein